MRAERPSSPFAAAALAAAVLAAAGAPARAVPLKFTVQGRLTDANGVNRDGAFDITARLWSAAEGGTLLYKETKTAVPVVNGNFALHVGGAPDADSPKPSLDQVFTGEAVYLEFQAAGETPMVPRQPLFSVPYAVRAQTVDSAPGEKHNLVVTVSPNSVRLQADFISVDGVGLKNVDVTAAVPAPAPDSWHSVNAVTDDAGGFLGLCVAAGDALLTPATLNARCGAAARRFRRVGWARATAAGVFRRVIHSGDHWDYDEDIGTLFAASISNWAAFQAFSMAAFVPPGARRALAQFHANNISTNITGVCVRPTGGTTVRCFQHYGPGGGQSNRDMLQELLTGPTRSVDAIITYGHNAAIWIVGYYDPI